MKQLPKPTAARESHRLYLLAKFLDGSLLPAKLKLTQTPTATCSSPLSPPFHPPKPPPAHANLLLPTTHTLLAISNRQPPSYYLFNQNSSLFLHPSSLNQSPHTPATTPSSSTQQLASTYNRKSLPLFPRYSSMTDTTVYVPSPLQSFIPLLHMRAIAPCHPFHVTSCCSSIKKKKKTSPFTLFLSSSRRQQQAFLNPSNRKHQSTGTSPIQPSVAPIMLPRFTPPRQTLLYVNSKLHFSSLPTSPRQETSVLISQTLRGSPVKNLIESPTWAPSRGLQIPRKSLLSPMLLFLAELASIPSLAELIISDFLLFLFFFIMNTMIKSAPAVLAKILSWPVIVPLLFPHPSPLSTRGLNKQKKRTSFPSDP